MVRKMLIAAVGVMLAGCSVQPGPDRVVEPRAFAGNAPRGTALMRQAMLAGHNAARDDVGVPPLTWNATLAADAQRYADVLARTGRFQHSDPTTRGSQPEGENLFTGTRGAYTYREMIDLLVAEKRYFRNAPTPYFSTTGKWEDVAHYTQIVWAKTRQFGCGFASNATSDYLVCRYTPPGNVVGQKAF